MAGKIDWEGRIGRRLKLRDLHVYFTVVQCGSMAKAAAELGVAQPTVSEIIAGLEHTFGSGCSTAGRGASSRQCTAAHCSSAASRRSTN